MTLQVQEKIRINRKEYEMVSRPFELFLEALNIKLLPLASTCWRGYIGAWEINNNVLYLVGIRLRYRLEDEEKLKPLTLDDVIFQATWYTGQLVVALVEPTWYNPSCKPVYTKEMHLTVKNGLIVNHKIIENEVPDYEDNGLPF